MPLAQSGDVTIHWQDWGQGRPLLLIMGFGQTGEMWKPVLPYFSDLRSVYFDNRGTGGSSRPTSGYAVVDMAADALAVMDAAGFESAHIYGVSMGGMIAQQLVLDHPDRVDRLVLGCTSAGGPMSHFPDPAVLADMVSGTEAMTTDPDTAADKLLPLLFTPEFIEANPAIREFMKLSISQDPIPAETPSRVMAELAAFDVSARLGEIDCPTLIVHGDRDSLLPVENGRELAKRIKGSLYHEIAGAGHAYMVQDPDVVNTAVAEFLRG